MKIILSRKGFDCAHGGIYYPGIWQELVLESENAQEWAKNLF
jgi:hypothetical protein